MIHFNEGLPGAGKSYDAVVTHILPALKAGRHVYARLNGFDVEKIASYLSLPADYVRERLHLVPDEGVHALAAMTAKDALIVIDEAHEFYVTGREKMPTEQEEMFAKHRHHGWDIVLISQWYKRVHSAIRARIERKSVFKKLNMLGSDKTYTVKHYTAVEPDKFEEIGVETKRYDPAVFPLYTSVVQGAENLTVYKAGGFTLWRKLAKYAIVVVPLGIFGVWYLIGFFTGSHPLWGGKPANIAAAPAVAHATAVPQQTGDAGRQPDATKKRTIDTSKMPPEIAYVFDLANDARPRLAASITVVDKKRTVDVIEFMAGQDHVVERINSDQLRAMGLIVQDMGYGVRIGWSDKALIVTSWPLDVQGKVSDADVQRIDAHPAFPSDRFAVAGMPSVASQPGTAPLSHAAGINPGRWPLP